MQCRICGNKELKEVLSLGVMPLANNFLDKEHISSEEPRFPLEICLCNECKLVQLTHVVDPEKMFRNYVYVTSTTKTFREHFTRMAQDISKRFALNSESLAVDIGSNDGLLLGGFKAMGTKVIGVEPATNLAKLAENNGIETVNDFFNDSAADEIIRRKGKADAVTATNVFAHVNDIHSLTRNVKKLLKDDGVFVIEIQYLLDAIEKMTFDNIYHEHLSYFTLTSLTNFFSRNGMEIFDLERNDSHGGTLRAYMQKQGGRRKASHTVNELLEYERKAGIEDEKTYQEFAGKVYGVKDKLLSYVKAIKAKGQRIAAYGAPAKGNTLLNFCGIGKEYIDYVIDDNPLKVGLYTPGTHIPVANSAMLDEETPDYVIILAWNFAGEILEKTKRYADEGVKFIIPLPNPVVV